MKIQCMHMIYIQMYCTITHYIYTIISFIPKVYYMYMYLFIYLPFEFNIAIAHTGWLFLVHFVYYHVIHCKHIKCLVLEVMETCR